MARDAVCRRRGTSEGVAFKSGAPKITVHRPEAVAAEQNRTVDDMVAEALNLLFAKYRKAEIAPRETKS
jgi:hypothetical protein